MDKEGTGKISLDAFVQALSQSLANPDSSRNSEHESAFSTPQKKLQIPLPDHLSPIGSDFEDNLLSYRSQTEPVHEVVKPHEGTLKHENQTEDKDSNNVDPDLHSKIVSIFSLLDPQKKGYIQADKVKLALDSLPGIKKRAKDLSFLLDDFSDSNSEGKFSLAQFENIVIKFRNQFENEENEEESDSRPRTNPKIVQYSTEGKPNQFSMFTSGEFSRTSEKEHLNSLDIENLKNEIKYSKIVDFLFNSRLFIQI